MPKRYFLFLLILIILTFAIPLITKADSPSLAQATKLQLMPELENAGKAAYGETTAGQMKAPGFVGATVGRIINACLGVLGIVLIVLVLYGGFLWMTAAGNEERITKAKKIFGNAIIGLIIVIMAYAISRFVICQLQAAATGISCF